MRYILVFSLTAAILITLASIASGLMALEGQKAAAYTRVTVIQKNQKQPTMAQLEERSNTVDNGSEVNSNDAVVVQRRSQWI